MTRFQHNNTPVVNQMLLKSLSWYIAWNTELIILDAVLEPITTNRLLSSRPYAGTPKWTFLQRIRGDVWSTWRSPSLEQNSCCESLAIKYFPRHQTHSLVEISYYLSLPPNEFKEACFMTFENLEFMLKCLILS